jgi:5-methyltetrahydrofolate--homocysteine methyltransferase
MFGQAGRILLGDGAMGTMLLEAGLPPGGCPELWNVERPEIVQQIHQAYFAAGCDFVETNTFGGSALKLAMYGLAARTEEINAAAARLARQVAPPGGLVAGSVGPCGYLLAPLGEKSAVEVLASFRRQIAGLRNGGVDFCYVETMSDTQEALLAIQAAQEAGLPAIGSLTFQQGKRGIFTMMGEDPATVARKLSAAGAQAVGANCGVGMELMISIIAALHEGTDRPLAAAPNAGLPVLHGDRVIYPESPVEMATALPRLVAAGASIIGGCCGTTPEHLQAFRAIL